MPGRAIVFEPVHADGWHSVGRTFVETDRKIEILGKRPKRRIHHIAQHLLAVIRVWPQETARHPKRLLRIAHFRHGIFDRLHRQHGHTEQAVGVRLTVIGQPAIVSAAHGGGEIGILDSAGKETEARIEKCGVDPVRIHVNDARVRVEATLAAFLVFQGVDLYLTLAHADGTEASDPARIAEQLPFDFNSLRAVFIDDMPRPAIPKRRIDIVIPQCKWFENVAVGIDGIVSL